MKNVLSEESKSNAVNLIIALLSCSLAPILSRILNLWLEDNEWGTERLLVLYFASVTGFVLQDKVYRMIIEAGLYKKGYKLGNSDAVGFIIWSLPVSIVVVMYNEIVSVVSLAVMTMVAIIIVSKDYNKIQLSSKTMIMSAGVLVLLVPFNIKVSPLLARENLTAFYFKWLIIQLIVCFLFDVIVKKVGELKTRTISKRE